MCGRRRAESASREERRRDLATKTDVRTEEFMLDYLDNAVVGLHWVDGDAKILWANKADYEPLGYTRSEEHTSELQSHLNLVCRLLLEKKKNMESVHILRN